MEFTLLPFNFPGNVYRSAMPYSSYDPDGLIVDAYRDNQISMVVMLADHDESMRISGHNLKEEYQNLGFEITHLPIQDFGTADVEDLRKIIRLVLSHTRYGGNVAIHCHAGIGRTGMFLAGLAKLGMGLPTVDSIQWVREYIPGAVEVREQAQLVEMV